MFNKTVYLQSNNVYVHSVSNELYMHYTVLIKLHTLVL